MDGKVPVQFALEGRDGVLVDLSVYYYIIYAIFWNIVSCIDVSIVMYICMYTLTSAKLSSNANGVRVSSSVIPHRIGYVTTAHAVQLSIL